MTVELFNPQSLHVTDAAIAQYRNIAKDTEYLRISLKGGGCSGFELAFDLNESAALADDDTIVNIDNAGIVVDPISMGYLAGAVIDYKVDLIGSMFTVDSPLATGTCGCGASLSF